MLSTVKEWIIEDIENNSWIIDESWSLSKFKNKAKLFTTKEMENYLNSGKSLGKKLLVHNINNKSISERIDDIDEMEEILKVYDSESKGFYVGIKKTVDPYELITLYVRRSEYYDTREQAQLALESKVYYRY